MALNREQVHIFAGASQDSSEFGIIGSFAQGQGTVASSAQPPTEEVAGTEAYKKGLTEVVEDGNQLPTMEEFNSLFYAFTRWLKYIYQSGVPEYMDREEYKAGSIVNANGVLYVSNGNANAAPPSNGWDRISVTPDMITNWNNKVTANPAIAKGTKTKITYDEKGLVTSGADLAASDIPNLDASKITSGTFADARISSAATWNAKQNAIPGSIDKVFTDAEMNTATGRPANSLARRSPSGYLAAVYLNQQSGNNENPTISQIFVQNSSDNFLRKASLDHLRNALSLDSWNNGSLVNAGAIEYGGYSYNTILRLVLVNVSVRTAAGTLIASLPSSVPRPTKNIPFIVINHTNSLRHGGYLDTSGNFYSKNSIPTMTSSDYLYINLTYSY